MPLKTSWDRINKYEGVPAEWIRLKGDDVPDWAEKAFNDIELEGLASYFARNEAKRK